MWNHIVGGAHFEAAHYPLQSVHSTMKALTWVERDFTGGVHCKTCKGYSVQLRNELQQQCGAGMNAVIQSVPMLDSASWLAEFLGIAVWHEGAEYCADIEALHQAAHSPTGRDQKAWPSTNQKKSAKEECTSVWRVPNNLPGSKWKRGGRLPWNPSTT